MNKHCEDHTEMAISCAKIAEIHEDVKAMRGELSAAIERAFEMDGRIKVQEDRWMNVKWALRTVVTVEGGIIIAVVAKIINT